MINGHGVSNFDQFVFRFVGTTEGFRSNMYWPEEDYPTIGYGVALIVPNSTNTSWNARSLETLNEWFAGVHTWAQTERDTLESIAAELRNDAGNDTDARVIFDSWSLVSTLTLTEPQGQTVFTNVVQSLADEYIPANFEEELAGTRELAVLYSLVYNGGGGLIGDNLKAAINAGDREEMGSECISFARNR